MEKYIKEFNFKNIIDQIYYIIHTYANRNAFCINDKFFSYSEFGSLISTIRRHIHSSNKQSSQYTNIGLVINDDIFTYASIIALWIEGKAYVPLHPNWPLERCMNIITQVGIQCLLDSSSSSRYESLNIINTGTLPDSDSFLDEVECVSDDNLAYILFTSGSTGNPKGVPISRKNLSAFVDSFFHMNLSINEHDKFLQCFDLSFDLSIYSYLIPLLTGGCIYTIPTSAIKFKYILKLFTKYKLSVALMAPSTINYLRPYFRDINIPSMRYCLFCGEALYKDVTLEWSQCIPNCRIFNVYGPTENTIFCTAYEVFCNKDILSNNGIISIGRPMLNVRVGVFSTQNIEISNGQMGELYLAGMQLFNKYWNNAEQTSKVFHCDANGTKWYKTGDLCTKDDTGNYMYIGRKDSQVQIQGYRVELGEIEYYARIFVDNKNVVCIPIEESGTQKIVMYIETSNSIKNVDLTNYLRSKLPEYMIPAEILCYQPFPLNTNGKIDRKQLKKMYYGE